MDIKSPDDIATFNLKVPEGEKLVHGNIAGTYRDTPSQKLALLNLLIANTLSSSSFVSEPVDNEISLEQSTDPDLLAQAPMHKILRRA